MKRNAIFSFVLAALFIVSSCGKYEEGPKFSLLSKKARLAGVWKIEKIFDDGNEVELDEYTKNTTIEIFKDGTGKISMTYGGMTFVVDMEWEFSDDKLELRSRVKDPTSGQWDEWEESKILRLTNKELWTLDEEGSDKIETHLAKQD